MSFVKTGNPNNFTNGSSIADFKWTAFNNDSRSFLEIGKKFIVKPYDSEPFKLFDEIFPLP